jgi:putative restriction endonuclease
MQNLPHHAPRASPQWTGYPENILCLCSNCPVLFDEFALCINDDLTIEERGSSLRVYPQHMISPEVLQYHRRICGR